jgi:MFS transporter, CP family, cyanate transporter
VLGIQLGAAGGASLSSALGTTVGWRAPLLVFGCLAGVYSLVWWRYTASGPATVPNLRAAGRDASLWRSSTVQLLIFVYGLQSFVFFGISAWLAPYLQQEGWSSFRAGQTISLIMVAGLVATLLTPTLLARAGSVQRVLMASGGLAVLSIVGLIVYPAGAWVLSFTAGLGMGPLLPTILQLPIVVADDVEDVATVSGIMLGLGYVLAATAPTVLGLLRDVTGSFDPVMWTLVVVMSMFILVCLPLRPEVLHRGVRDI